MPILLDLNIYNHLDEPKDESELNEGEFQKTVEKETNASIFSKINKTITFAGNRCLKQHLENPCTDYEELIKNQQIILKTYYSQGNVSVIHNYLQDIKKIEQDVAWVWKEHDQETNAYINNLFFYYDIFNREILLNMNTMMKMCIIPLSVLLFPIIGFVVANLMGLKESLFSFFCNTYQITVKSYRMLFSLLTRNNSIKTYGPHCIVVLYCLFYFYRCYSTIYSVWKLYKQHSTLYTYASKISNYCQNIANIYEHDIFVKPMIKVPKLEKTIRYLLNIYNKKLFTPGYCLILWKNRNQYKQEVESLSSYMGMVDYFTSMINIIREYPSYFCFPIFRKPVEKPFIGCIGTWHPELLSNGLENTIRNNVVFGDHYGTNNHMILTGPNASGKSTLMKSLALSVYLSQTIGISNCEFIEFTPFSIIDTYMNIPDRIGSESLFEAESNRCLQLFDNIKNSNGFVLTIMDEIFTGTNLTEGISGAYGICKKFREFNNCISIISTHYDFLTRLEKEHPRIFKNFHMEIVKKKNELLIEDDEKQNSESDDTDTEQEYTYKLKPGVNIHKVALNIMEKKGFDKDVIDNSKIAMKNMMHVLN